MPGDDKGDNRVCPRGVEEYHVRPTRRLRDYRGRNGGTGQRQVAHGPSEVINFWNYICGIVAADDRPRIDEEAPATIGAGVGLIERQTS